MKSLTSISLAALASLPLLGLAGAQLHSGLAPGAMVSAFEPTHVSGPDAGTKTCPICKYGKAPAVQVWVNGDTTENVAKIADALEGAIKMEGGDKLKAFVVFIRPSNVSASMLEGQLKMVAEKCKLSHVALTYVDGPASKFVGQYKINTSSKVKNTVLVYHDMKVDANFVNLQGDQKGLMALKGAMMKACGM